MGSAGRGGPGRRKPAVVVDPKFVYCGESCIDLSYGTGGYQLDQINSSVRSRE